MRSNIILDSSAKKMLNQKLLIPRIITLLVASIMVVCVFLPYATATTEFAEAIELSPDTMVIEELDLTAKDMKNVSMAKFARIWFVTRDQYWDPTECVLRTIMVVLIGLFSLAASGFAFFGKPIPVITLTALVYGVFAFQNWTYIYEKKIPSETYDWGIAHTLMPIIIILTLVCAICMLVMKIIAKKQIKLNLSEQTEKAEDTQ